MIAPLKKLNLMWRETRNKLIFLAVAVTAFFIAIFLAGTLHIASEGNNFALVSFPDPFLSITINAKSAIVYNPANEESPFEKSADTQLPLASLTKVLTVVTALDYAEPNEIITILATALEESGDDGLYLGEKWALEELIKFSLVGSSNDGVRAIADHIEKKTGESFVTLMNKKLSQLGLTNTRVENPTGLDIERRRAGGVGTTRDMAKLFAYAVTTYPEIFEITARPNATLISQSGVKHFVENTNVYVSQTTRIIASKTGTTPLAGGNLAIMIDLESGRPVVLVVLSSTEYGRGRDIEALIRSAQKYYIAETKILEASGVSPH